MLACAQVVVDDNQHPSNGREGQCPLAHFVSFVRPAVKPRAMSSLASSERYSDDEPATDLSPT